MFDLSFEIRSGGTVKSTIDFNTTGYKLLDGYYPAAGVGSDPVTESFYALLNADSDSDLVAIVRGIEAALDFARDHKEGPDGVWVLFSPEHDVLTAWQSRLSGGVLLHDEKLISGWKHNKLKVQVVIERQPFWEEEDPTTLNLTNRGGTGSSANIVNHQDSGATDDFYVEIAADQIGAGIPAPAVIEYKNTVNDGVLVDHLMVGHFAASAPNDPPAASSLVFEGSGNSDGNCSANNYDDLTWADVNENQLLTWSFASAAFRQRYYKLIARLRDVVAYTDLWLKVKLLSGSTVLAETRWALVSAGEILIVIGSMKIPPFRQNLYIDLGNLTLALYEKRAGGAGTLNLDFIAAFPMDSWRVYGAISGLAYNETLIDDPVNSILYTAAGASYKITHVIDEGDPIMLMPGVKNELYFLHDTTTGTAPIARTANIVIKYHSRRRTI
jgi:hypothetical protein